MKKVLLFLLYAAALIVLFISIRSVIKFKAAERAAAADERRHIKAILNARRDDISPPNPFTKEIRYSGHPAISDDGKTLDISKLTDEERVNGIDIIATYFDNNGEEIPVMQHWSPWMLGVAPIPNIVDTFKVNFKLK